MFDQSLKEPSSDVVAQQGDGDPEVLDGNDPAALEKRGTEFDNRDMHRMGKLPQLRVRYTPSRFKTTILIALSA